jgi:hypothetical protein
MTDNYKPRAYTVLVADEELNVEEMHPLSCRADAIDRAGDLIMEKLAQGKYKWFKVAPSDVVEEEL